MSEVSLAAEVLSLAVKDALAGAALHRPSAEHAAATSFCTDVTGDWAQARQNWCDAAGIDPIAFVERVGAMLAKAAAARKPPAPPAEKRWTPKRLDALRALAASGASSADIYQAVARLPGAAVSLRQVYYKRWYEGAAA